MAKKQEQLELDFGKPQGPVQGPPLPRPSDPNFIGPRELIGPKPPTSLLKAGGKRGLLSLLLRGGGSLAGGPIGIGLLGLSLLPLLFAGDRMSQADRERAIKEITSNQKAQRLAARRTNRRNPIADSIYERDLDRGFAEATRPQGSISPDLAALLGEEQGRLESLNESLGGSQRISLDQALRGMGS